jgi:hypothetical protein
MTRVFSEEHRRKLSEAQTRRWQDPVLRKRQEDVLIGNQRAAKPHIISPEGLLSLREATRDGKNWRGGDTGDTFAEVLCPVGFVREYHLYFGPNNSRQVVMDFAHVEGQVNVELDGPLHVASKDEDAQRDAALRSLGWRIIRIRHD